MQFGLSLRDSIEQWNKGTTRWLRMIVYERAPRFRTVLTYALSALWHGFYPGYYLTFMSGALFTFASRSVSSLLYKMIAVTMICIAHLSFCLNTFKNI